MARHLVVGTAGHIDHGKTTLVKALTGVDTDRLAEEKARGITIDIGFAPLAIGDLALSVVDVPGHEAFIRNMVAGATGIDVALLVVAADEGVMPQTREHVAILSFLGVRRGVVALTKCDVAPDPEWRALVSEDVGALLAGAVGARWPVVAVSATTGEGLDAVRAALADAARDCAERDDADLFRMPVDRVFALPGAGTIVTGTVWSGAVAEGDTVSVLPAGVAARVRSVQVHGRAAPHAVPGHRTALALVGLEREQAARGAVVVAGGGWRVTRSIDVLATMVPGWSLEPRRRVRLHHGTAEVIARVARVEPREGGVAARLVLADPLVARAGDRAVLRSWSPVTTIGGAVVLDPWAGQARGRAGRALMASWASEADRVRQLVAARGPAGIARGELAVACGLGASGFAAALGRLGDLGLVETDGWLVAEREVGPVARRLTSALSAYHAAHPLEPGMPLQSWRAAGKATAALVGLAEQRLLAQGAAQRDGSLARVPGWAPGGGDRAATQREQILEVLRAAGGEPPSVPELAAALPALDVPGILRLLAREGRVVSVSVDRYYETGALEVERTRLVAAVIELSASGGATASALRERLGRSRKYLIPFLEWADREGLTKREGDRRVAGANGVLDGTRKPT